MPWPARDAAALRAEAKTLKIEALRLKRAGEYDALVARHRDVGPRRLETRARTGRPPCEADGGNAHPPFRGGPTIAGAEASGPRTATGARSHSTRSTVVR